MWLNHLCGDELDNDEQPQRAEGEGPSGNDGDRQRACQQRCEPHPNVGDEPQERGECAPERRLWNSQNSESQPDRGADAEVDGELGYEEPRKPLARVVERKGRQPYVGPTGDADEPVPQRFVLKQHEHQYDQHNPGGLDGDPDRCQHSCHDLQRGGEGLVQLNRNWSSTRRGCPGGHGGFNAHRVALNEPTGLTRQSVEPAHGHVIQFA
jgi:hypothetical protein